MTIRVEGIGAPRSRPPISHGVDALCGQAAIAARVPIVESEACITAPRL